MHLRHIHIPTVAKPHLVSYALATSIQSILQSALLTWKAQQQQPQQQPATSRPPPPPPTLLSFTPTPTYTLGRRQTEPLTASELDRLRAPLRVTTTTTTTTHRDDHAPITTTTDVYVPDVTHAPRGGLTTYHGPGQTVLWPVIDLRSPAHRHFSVRDYACLLEKTTMATLGLRGVRGFTTENPGVWVSSSGGGEEEGRPQEERKIAALGVHLRRHVTGLGVAINGGMPVRGRDAGENPWARIVACGLGDKEVTSLAEVLRGEEEGEEEENLSHQTWAWERNRDVASAWAREFAARLGLADGVVDVDPEAYIAQAEAAAEAEEGLSREEEERKT
ncbi:hypothetical protein F4778DRAFT_391684 [Xylariomycetidae sp. FL2044]|nr:hypothetical protein F4778DRAFT_391684 [Xylariomycetidae sp. FL2044]